MWNTPKLRGKSVEAVLIRLFYAGLFLASASLAFPVFADNKEEVERETQKLEALRQRIQAVVDSLASKQEEQQSGQAKLREIEKSLSDKTKEVRRLNREVATVNGRLAELRSEQSGLKTTLTKQRQHLATQIRSAYFTGNQEQLKLLLNQQDPSALARVLKYYEYLNRARLTAIEETQSTLTSLATVEQKISSGARELAALQGSVERERQKLADQHKARKALLTNLEKEITSHQQSVYKLRQDETRVRELIASLSGIFADIPQSMQLDLNFPQSKGLLPWPTKGSNLNKFGDAREGSDLVWRGIQIRANTGTEVRSISHGRVAFADWMPGFGLIMIIDHSHGYISLYGHNEALYKETGDWVQQGDVIATVGNSGGHQQSALYFEIRYQGKPVDPQQWCVS